jgi:hypothetical protein
MAENDAKIMCCKGVLNTNGSIYIPILQKTFDTKSINNCQPVFGRDIIFIGSFSDNVIDLKQIDDLSTEENVEKIGKNFISIIEAEGYLCIGLPLSVCSLNPDEESNTIDVKCHIQGETVHTKVSVDTLKAKNKFVQGLKDTNDIDKVCDIIYCYDNLVLVSKKESAVINRENKEISLDFPQCFVF